MNTGAPWPGLDEAEMRVRVMQTKLHHWAMADPGRRFDDRSGGDVGIDIEVDEDVVLSRCAQTAPGTLDLTRRGRAQTYPA